MALFGCPDLPSMFPYAKSLSLSAIRYNFKQYLAGSISLAICAGLVAGGITLILLKMFSKKNQAIV